MFSEKYRLLKIMILGAIVFVLCAYAAWAGPRVDIPPAEILAGQNGLPSPISAQYTEIIALDSEAQTMLLKTEGHEFTARFNAFPDAKVGQTLSLIGTVRENDFVEVSTWHLHPARALKYYFSLPAIILVIYLLFKKYRFDWRTFEFFEKREKIQNS